TPQIFRIALVFNGSFVAMEPVTLRTVRTLSVFSITAHPTVREWIRMSKIKIIIVLLLLGGAFPTYDVSAAVNLLLNSSFEIDSIADFLPDNWLAANLHLQASMDGQDCTTSTEASCSMRIQGDGTNKSIRQKILQSGTAGNSFTLIFDAQGTGL